MVRLVENAEFREVGKSETTINNSYQRQSNGCLFYMQKKEGEHDEQSMVEGGRHSSC